MISIFHDRYHIFHLVLPPWSHTLVIFEPHVIAHSNKRPLSNVLFQLFTKSLHMGLAKISSKLCKLILKLSNV